jgi:hypothetical protein
MSNVNKFGKPRCTRIKTEPNGYTHTCGYPQFKDGLCKKHHPSSIAEKAAEQERWRQENELRDREYKAERLKALAGIEGSSLTIDNAILLLVKNGYRVEKLTDNS